MCVCACVFVFVCVCVCMCVYVCAHSKPPLSRIVGSATRNYLLEKIRVVQPSENERNFHIFYQVGGGGVGMSLGQVCDQPPYRVCVCQLIKAAPKDLRAKLKLKKKASKYKFLGK